MVSFGETIKTLREERGLSQTELAKELNTTSQTIGRYEQSKREPNFLTLSQLSDFFNVSIDFLLGKTPLRNQYREEMKLYFGTKMVDEINDSLNYHPIEIRESILKMITELSSNIADLAYPVNVDKLYILSIISSSMNGIVFAAGSSFRERNVKYETMEEYTQLVKECLESSNKISSIVNKFYLNYLSDNNIFRLTFKDDIIKYQ